MRGKINFLNKINVQISGMLLILFAAISVTAGLINQNNIRSTYEEYFTERVLQTNALMASYLDDIGDIAHYVELLKNQDAGFKQRQIQYYRDREELFELQSKGASEEDMRELTNRLNYFRRETETLKDEDYWQIIGGLKALKESSLSTYVYILADTGLPAQDGGRYYSFIFDADDTPASEDIITDGLGTCTIGEDYLTITIESGKQMDRIEYYEGVYGKLYYAYAPILDSDGNVIAALGTDLEIGPMNDMISSSTALFNTFFLIFFTATFLFIFTYLVINVTRPLNKLTRAANEFTRGHRDITISDKILGQRGEIGILARALKGAIEESGKSIDYLEYTLNNVAAMICVTDPETDDILFINDEMKRMLRVPENYSEMKCYEALHGLDKRCDYCPCDELDLETNKEVIWEQSHIASNRVYRSYSRYVTWPGGKTAHIQYAVDMTDIKNMQESLLNQNTRLNLLINSVNIALWDADANYEADSLISPDNEISFSGEFTKMLGYADEDEFPNVLRSWFSHVHPDDLDTVVAKLLSHIEDTTNKTLFDVEYRMKLKTGEYKWFRGFGAALRDADGRPLRMIGAIEDINERKNFERELAEKSEMNQIMFSKAPVGLTVFDENYKVIDCNDNVLKMFGVTSKEAYIVIFNHNAHSPVYQPDGSKSREKAVEMLKRAFDGEILKLEWLHTTRDGEPLPVELTVMRVKQSEKYVVLGYTYDMREQQRLKKDLEAALHKAEAANQAKSVFLANMSHEIRTPMNAILGITEIELHKEALPPDTVEALGKIYDSGDLLLKIINDILDFSKIEAGKLEILPSEYNLLNLVNETVQMNLIRYDNKLIEFSLDVDENVPVRLLGDRLRIKQIVGNLLSNAFKYTDKGKIEMSVRTIRNDSEQKTDTVLVFCVSDTGRGMTGEQLEKLFEEYTRFNLYINRAIPGTGLGMSITKRLIDLMGGKITVESEINEGTTFTVYLPQKSIDNIVCGPEAARQLRDFRFRSEVVSKGSSARQEFMQHGKVLIVDDMESNIYVARGMLLPYKLQIDTAVSGIEAIEKVKGGESYDIILMDYMMPRMNGMEAAKILRDMGYTKAIVAFTANALTGQADTFLQNGFDAFISKPIDSRELNNVLNKFIGYKSPAGTAATPQGRLKSVPEKDSPGGFAGHQAPVSAAPGRKELSELEQYFVIDAQNALMTLDGLTLALGDMSDAELNDFEITIHGIKSALANIGEKALSDTALKLEKAAKEKDFDYLSEETPVFITALKSLTEQMEK